MHADVGVTQIVGDDDEDVGRSRREGGGRQRDKTYETSGGVNHRSTEKCAAPNGQNDQAAHDFVAALALPWAFFAAGGFAGGDHAADLGLATVSGAVSA